MRRTSWVDKRTLSKWRWIRETGEVQLTNVVCVNDVGHIFNRQGAEAQQYGGAVMGIGKSATEEKVYCPRTGVGLNFDHINYHFGTMNDYPVVQCLLNESHLGYAAFGAFGWGRTREPRCRALPFPPFIMQRANG